MGSTYGPHLVIVHTVCDTVSCAFKQYELRHFMAGRWNVPMCNHLAVTFRMICFYAHCNVCPYDTSYEGRDMVYFHTNDIVIEMVHSSTLCKYTISKFTYGRPTFGNIDTISLPRTLLSAITCTILHHLPVVMLLLIEWDNDLVRCRVVVVVNDEHQLETFAGRSPPSRTVVLHQHCLGRNLVK